MFCSCLIYFFAFQSPRGHLFSRSERDDGPTYQLTRSYLVMLPLVTFVVALRQSYWSGLLCMYVGRISVLVLSWSWSMG
jgi:hypothetical protein